MDFQRHMMCSFQCWTNWVERWLVVFINLWNVVHHFVNSPFHNSWFMSFNLFGTLCLLYISILTQLYVVCLFFFLSLFRGRRGRDRMVVGFTTTHAISAYHHWCQFESRLRWGVHHYVIKFVSDLRQVGGFLRVLRFPPPVKLTATI